MVDDMGTFRIDVEVENPRLPGARRALRSLLVDTGSELSWMPADVLESLGIERRSQRRFRQADGTVLERWTGPAFVYAAGRTATDAARGAHRSCDRHAVPGDMRRAPHLPDPQAGVFVAHAAQQVDGGGVHTVARGATPRRQRVHQRGFTVRPASPGTRSRPA